MPACADGDGLGGQPVFRGRRALPDVPDAQRLLRAGERRMYRGAAERMRKISLPGADRNRGRSHLRAAAAGRIRRLREDDYGLFVLVAEVGAHDSRLQVLERAEVLDDVAAGVVEEQLAVL